MNVESALTVPWRIEEEALLASLLRMCWDIIDEGALYNVRPSTVWEEAVAGPSGTEMTSPGSYCTHSDPTTALAGSWGCGMLRVIIPDRFQNELC